MKNLFLSLLVGLALGFLLGITMQYVFMKPTVAVSSSKVLSHPLAESFRIAIMVPLSHPALEEIKQGFIETLNKGVTCTYDTYNANGDRTLMRSQAEAVVNKGYDLVFAIATQPALIVKEVMTQRGKEIPLIAGAVAEPVENHLIASMEQSGNCVTAVTGCDNFEQQLDLLQLFKPEVKKIVLVYNPAPMLEAQREKLSILCQKKGLNLAVIPVFSIAEISQKLSALADDIDVMMVLKDNLVVSAIESLVTLCNRKGITLYASDLNSGDKGAVLAYGVREYDDGVESALKAKAILIDHKHPSEIPSSFSNNFKCKINRAMMQSQGICIDECTLFLMAAGEVL